MPSDRDPQHLYQPFRDAYALVLKDMQVWLDKHRLGMTVKMIEGFRNANYQAELYAKGRTTPGPVVTYRSGKPGNESNHQSALAADAGFFKNGGSVYVPEPGDEVMEYYAHCIRAHGLKAGLDWKHPDGPHAEWDEADHATYAAARKWIEEEGLR